MNNLRRLLSALLPPVVLGGGINLLAQLLLRHLYRFLGPETQFGGIFAQLLHQPMDGRPALIVLILGLYWLPVWSFWPEKPRLRPIFAVLGGLVALAAFVLAVLETRVNGIRFGFVLFSLLELLQKGVL